MSAIQYCLFDQLPLITTRLVCEARLPFSDRIQVSIPADVAPILMDYFRDKDREEFLIVLLNTANVVVGLSQISVGGLAASVVEPRQVFKVAVLANAAALILAHNHPSGAPRGAYVECYNELARLKSESMARKACMRTRGDRYVSIPLRQLFCEFSVASPALVRYTPSPRLTRFVVIG